MAKKHSLGGMLVFGAITGALGGIAAYKHRKAIERTLQDIADQMDAWEDDGDFFPTMTTPWSTPCPAPPERGSLRRGSCRSRGGGPDPRAGGAERKRST